jgi:hypothetical protein
VPEEAWDDLIPSAASHEIRRSGLFGAQSTTAMLVLARDMRAHSFYLREATRLEPHMVLRHSSRVCSASKIW